MISFNQYFYDENMPEDTVPPILAQNNSFFSLILSCEIINTTRIFVAVGHVGRAYKSYKDCRACWTHSTTQKAWRWVCSSIRAVHLPPRWYSVCSTTQSSQGSVWHNNLHILYSSTLVQPAWILFLYKIFVRYANSWYYFMMKHAAENYQWEKINSMRKKSIQELFYRYGLSMPINLHSLHMHTICVFPLKRSNVQLPLVVQSTHKFLRTNGTIAEEHNSLYMFRRC